MGFKEVFRKLIFIFMGLLVFVLIIGLIVLFPTDAAHQTILEYLKVILSWPGVALILAIVLACVYRSIISPKTKIVYEELPKPKVTGFINIEGKTEDGNLIISGKKYTIEDGDVVVNKGFIMKFMDNLTKIKTLELELERYKEKLLEK
jgi:hypothetical protein